MPSKNYWLKENHPLRGLCYVMAEVLYHNGAKEAGYRPYRATCWGISHWWLQNAQGHVLDITADQFTGPFPYERGKPAGFLTKLPSARTELLMGTLDRIRYGK